MQRRIGFLVLVFGVVFSMMLISHYVVNDVLVFINTPTLVYFILIILGTVLTTSGFKGFVISVNGVLSRKYQMTDEDRDKGIELFTMLTKTVTQGGVALIFISLCLMLLRFDDLSALGPSMAVAFNSVLYASLINMLLLNPAIYILKHRAEAEPARTARVKDKAAADKLLQLCFEKGLTFEEIMQAEEISLRGKQ